MQLISQGISETTFETVINEMICNAWYSVREFHIHLSGMMADGQVRDGLERAVLTLSELSDLPANASKVEIKNAIKEHTMYSELVSSYQQTFNSFVGPCEVLVSGETLQINDYSKLDWEWSIFDPEQKRQRRETVFPQERKKAFEMGKTLAER